MKLTLQKKPETDLDYVEIYAIKLKKDFGVIKVIMLMKFTSM